MSKPEDELGSSFVLPLADRASDESQARRRIRIAAEEIENTVEDEWTSKKSSQFFIFLAVFC